jgi:hypothetical protein
MEFQFKREYTLVVDTLVMGRSIYTFWLKISEFFTAQDIPIIPHKLYIFKPKICWISLKCTPRPEQKFLHLETGEFIYLVLE